MQAKRTAHGLSPVPTPPPLTVVFEPRTIRRVISELSHREIDVALGFPTRQGLGFVLGARDAKIELARSLLALPVA